MGGPVLDAMASNRRSVGQGLGQLLAGLQEAVADALKKVPAEPKAQRFTKEMVAEVIVTVRCLERLMTEQSYGSATQSYGSATTGSWDRYRDQSGSATTQGPPVSPDLSGGSYVAFHGLVDQPEEPAKEPPEEPSKSEDEID